MRPLRKAVLHLEECQPAEEISCHAEIIAGRRIFQESTAHKSLPVLLLERGASWKKSRSKGRERVKGLSLVP